MKDLNVSNLEWVVYFLEFLLFWLAVGIIVLVAILVIDFIKNNKTKRKDAEAEYEAEHTCLSKAIREYPLNEFNFKYLEDWLDRLSKMKRNNREKTEVLWMRFVQKYEAFIMDKNYNPIKYEKPKKTVMTLEEYYNLN